MGRDQAEIRLAKPSGSWVRLRFEERIQKPESARCQDPVELHQIFLPPFLRNTVKTAEVQSEVEWTVDSVKIRGVLDP